MTYDPKKAKALFDQHIRPVSSGGGFGPVQWLEMKAKGAAQAYVVTPEMLSFLHYRNACSTNSNPNPYGVELATALKDHLWSLSDMGVPQGWPGAIALEPKPAWRVAADEALDNGASYTEMFDAIEKALEAKQAPSIPTVIWGH